MAKIEPVIQVRDGAISLSGFENEIKGKDGKKFTVVNFTFQRTWKEGDEFKHNSSVQANDLLRASKLFADAYGKFVEWRSKQKREE